MEKKMSFNDLINSETPVLVDFSAEWCGPCKAMIPVLSEVVEEMGEKAQVVKIDVDKNRALAQQLGIRGVPTLIIYQKGEIKWRDSGMKSTRFLTDLLEKYSKSA